MSLSFRVFYPVGLLAVCLFSFLSFAQDTDLHIVTESSPPYQMLINGEVAGIATDKVKKIIEKAGLSASFNLYPWARAYKMALNQPNTLIYALAKTDTRLALFHWLSPVTSYDFGLVKLTHRDDIYLNSLADIKNYRFAVQREDISHEWLLKQGLVENEHFITCSDINCSWQLLLNKNVDLIIETPELIDDMLKRYQQQAQSAVYVMAIPELAITGYLASNYHIDPVFLAKLQQAIASHQ